MKPSRLESEEHARALRKRARQESEVKPTYEELEAACAEMRAALERLQSVIPYRHCANCELFARTAHSVSLPDAGRGWVNPEEMELAQEKAFNAAVAATARIGQEVVEKAVAEERERVVAEQRKLQNHCEVCRHPQTQLGLDGGVYDGACLCEAVVEEREACAKVADDAPVPVCVDCREGIAAAIRARGGK